MRILITGGLGYIGGYLAKELKRDGHDVILLDTLFNAAWNANEFNEFGIMRDSVTNIDVVSRALKGVDVVYHLAARMDWSQAFRHPIKLYRTNVLGTANVLTAARDAGVDQVVVASSAAVYGNVDYADEDCLPMPINSYGCTKLAMEAVCRDFGIMGLNVVVLRFFNVWGGMVSRSVVNKFVDGHSSIYGDGGQTRDFVYIGDVISALMQARLWDPLIYNIGTGVSISVQDLWSMIRTDKPELEGLRSGQPEIYMSGADMDSTYRRVPWRPKVMISELKKTDIIRLSLSESLD